MTQLGRNPVVLVIDDSEQDITLIRAAFKHLNKRVDVQAADSSVAARAYMTGNAPFADRTLHPRPDLVLLDIQMPIEDGMEILRWIRTHDAAWRRVPVIMLTTAHDYKEIRMAYDLGANSFLVKPTGFLELAGLILQIHDYWLVSNRVA